MKRLLLSFSALVLGVTAPAAAETTPAPGSTPATANSLDEFLSANPGEPPLFPALRGVRLLASPDQVTAPGFPADGLQTAFTPSVRVEGMAVVLLSFLDRPQSQASLDRLVAATRTYLRYSGRPFTSVYLPPQDVTGGYVQIVIAESRSEGAVTVTGARHFSKESYQHQIRQQAGTSIALQQLADDVAWLNRNPFRRVDVSAQAGATPGTTNLVLRADERPPLSVNAGYSTTGTKLTDENRISAGLTWGNAFGRGDLLVLGASGDPAWAHVRSYNASYTAFLPWRHVLSLVGAYSTLESVMPEPFTQGGTSWQVGANYEVPLRAPRAGWTQSLNFAADFKYSDNTLEFAAIPITGNITHVVQFGATYGVTLPLLGGQSSVVASAYASPGHLSRYNDNTSFEGSRAGAKAGYAYTKLTLSHQRRLGRGFTANVSATAQFATGALLGSEQMSGAGTYAVRGYAENSAFGDGGVIVNSELHAPALPLPKRKGDVDLFAFFDAASLHLRVDRQGTELAGAGLGVNVRILNHVALRAAYGWQLKRLDGGGDSGHAHVGATLNW